MSNANVLHGANKQGSSSTAYSVGEKCGHRVKSQNKPKRLMPEAEEPRRASPLRSTFGLAPVPKEPCS